MSAIAIFVKTPGLSTVKSRLAAGIGSEQAADCHLRCARAVAAIAGAAGIGPVYWAVAESEGMNHPAWGQLPRLLQEGAGLGERMRSIHDVLCQRHGAGILIGADLPQVEARSLQAAAAHLHRGPGRAVLGPARDGGFWLIGANQPLPRAAWHAPRYGNSTVADDFLAAVDGELDWLRLDWLSDLDHPHDLDPVIDALHRLPAPHPLQADLLQWLRRLPQPSATARPSPP